ncbi:unnamed protein product [Zymoseptoria tritici ST99CH_3D7]|uniref:Uncharacterized protein n=1 Tax=Zymoseptoria tritici (strain ST99CH_3D7) TaxID=1276538 RepID=A0A1X7REP2_ZYMT9|nr:unnamed protein product [Zymoseptoria tritici ST99CH_3D7]
MDNAYQLVTRWPRRKASEKETDTTTPIKVNAVTEKKKQPLFDAELIEVSHPSAIFCKIMDPGMTDIEFTEADGILMRSKRLPSPSRRRRISKQRKSRGRSTSSSSTDDTDGDFPPAIVYKYYVTMSAAALARASRTTPVTHNVLDSPTAIPDIMPTGSKCREFIFVSDGSGNWITRDVTPLVHQFGTAADTASQNTQKKNEPASEDTVNTPDDHEQPQAAPTEQPTRASSPVISSDKAPDSEIKTLEQLHQANPTWKLVRIHFQHIEHQDTLLKWVYTFYDADKSGAARFVEEPGSDALPLQDLLEASQHLTSGAFGVDFTQLSPALSNYLINVRNIQDGFARQILSHTITCQVADEWDLHIIYTALPEETRIEEFGAAADVVDYLATNFDHLNKTLDEQATLELDEAFAHGPRDMPSLSDIDSTLSDGDAGSQAHEQHAYGATSDEAAPPPSPQSAGQHPDSPHRPSTPPPADSQPDHASSRSSSPPPPAEDSSDQFFDTPAPDANEERDMYFTHLSHVKETPGGGEVTKDTFLATLYQPGPRDDNDWVRIETGGQGYGIKVIEPSTVPCVIDFDNGDNRNPDGLAVEGYFNAWDVAPSVKLRMALSSKHVPGTSYVAQAHINVPFTGARALTEVTMNIKKGDHFMEITIKGICNGAFIVDGMRSLLDHYPRFSDDDKRIFDFYYGMTQDDFKPIPVELRLHQCRQKPDKDGPQKELMLTPFLQTLFNNCKYTAEPGTFVPKIWDSQPYRPFRTVNNKLVTQHGAMYSAGDLMLSNRNFPAPMMPFRAADSFQDLDEWRTKKTFGFHFEYAEDLSRLAEFCAVPHELTLFHIENKVVAAIKYGNFKSLQGDDDVKIRIANGTIVELEWEGRSGGHVQKATGVVFSNNVWLGQCDMAIALIDRDTASFGSSKADTSDGEQKGQSKAFKDLTDATEEQQDKYFTRKTYKVTLNIKPNETVIKQQIHTLNCMASEDCKDWHKIILNQQPFDLPTVDPCAAPADFSLEATEKHNALVEQAYQTVLAFRDWNTEQLAALQALRSNPGPLVLVTGPAGTGKTTLMTITAWFFYEIGCHVVIDAPAHTNVEDFVNRLTAEFPALKPLRLVPKSSEASLTTLFTPHGQDETLPDDEEHSAMYQDILQVLGAPKKKYIGTLAYQLEQQLLSALDNPENKYEFRYFQPAEKDDDSRIGPDAEINEPKKANHDPSEAEAQVEDEHNASYSKATSDEDKWYEDRDAARRQYEMDQDSQREEPAKAPLPNLTQVRESPDSSTEVPLPPGWVCKLYTTTLAGTKTDTLYFISPEGKLFTTHPSEETEESVKSKMRDLFVELRGFRDRRRKTPMNEWKNLSGATDLLAIKCFKYAFKLFKKWLTAHSRLVCGTSASTNNKDMRTVFAAGKMGAKKSIGVVVIKDESAKDTEANSLGSIAACSYRKLVRQVWMCGDELQLIPTVTGQVGKYMVNMFRADVARSFFARLIAQRHPHTRLVKQNRMAEVIARLPNLIMYRGLLETADDRKKPLEQDIPGLAARLCKNYHEFANTELDLTDDHVRCHGFIVNGEVHKNPRTMSRLNPEQMSFTIDRLVPIMQEQFGRDTRDECLIITGYGETVTFAESLIYQLRKQSNLPRSHYPNVQTIDSSQGTEYKWVVFVATAQDANVIPDIGFLHLNYRINVAATRSSDVFTFVAGPLAGFLKEKVKLNSTTGQFGSMLCAISLWMDQKRCLWKVDQPSYDLSTLPRHMKEEAKPPRIAPAPAAGANDGWGDEASAPAAAATEDGPESGFAPEPTATGTTENWEDAGANAADGSWNPVAESDVQLSAAEQKARADAGW